MSLNSFECCICYEIFKDPIECNKCNNNFCREHVKLINKCPICKHAPFVFHDNIWLKREIEKMKMENICKCSLCDFKGDNNIFLIHLIEKHKKELIDHFQYKANKNIDNNINNNDSYKEKQYKDYKYIGEFKNDKPEGKGKAYYDNGTYEGEWKNGMRQGKGIYTFKNGDKYEGDYQNNIPEGKGKYYYNNGDIYEGDYKNGLPNGKGIFYIKNGNRHEGDFKNGKAEGKGIFYYSNGDRYEGEWKNWLKHGKGIFYYNNGDREMGDYSNDKKVGQHITLCFNGNIMTNNFNF